MGVRLCCEIMSRWHNINEWMDGFLPEVYSSLAGLGSRADVFPPEPTRVFFRERSKKNNKPSPQNTPEKVRREARGRRSYLTCIAAAAAAAAWRGRYDTYLETLKTWIFPLLHTFTYLYTLLLLLLSLLHPPGKSFLPFRPVSSRMEKVTPSPPESHFGEKIEVERYENGVIVEQEKRHG